MILTALADYYDQLLREGEVADPGWCERMVKFTLVIDECGKLCNIVPSSEKRGDRRIVPEQLKRTSGVAANFLCDNSSYLLGVDTKGKPARSAKCFEAARVLHREVLDGVDSLAARAVISFFDAWDAAASMESSVILSTGDDLVAGGNLSFAVKDASGGLVRPEEDAAIKRAWLSRFEKEPDGEPMVCLVSGRRMPVARVHPAIKGVAGAQSSGATLVGFNSPAFESYGHAQGENAPVSEESAKAYAAALNYLLANENHNVHLGDTSVVFWSERNDVANSSALSLLLGGRAVAGLDAAGVDKQIKGVMDALSGGRLVDDGSLDLSSKFYILGIAPNAARLSVRFFLTGEFGELLKNIQSHYERLEITRSPQARKYVTPYFLLKTVENENANKPVVSSVLVSGLFRSILWNMPYPEALYQNALLRIKATRKVTRERAAIVRACLLKNHGYTKEELMADLNDGRCEAAYSLGRVFALLEQVQMRANGAVTITVRYLDSASATPAVVFPVLLRLANAHLAKIRKDAPGLATYFSRSLGELLDERRIVTFPKHLSLTQQGDFFLGYYQEKWKNFSAAAAEEDETRQTKDEEE